MEKMPTYKEIHQKLSELSHQSLDERQFFGETTITGIQTENKDESSSKVDVKKFFQTEYVCPWQIS